MVLEDAVTDTLPSDPVNTDETLPEGVNVPLEDNVFELSVLP
jgi:hypothetical protein